MGKELTRIEVDEELAANIGLLFEKKQPNRSTGVATLIAILFRICDAFNMKIEIKIDGVEVKRDISDPEEVVN